jgi:hypothetical protein
MDERLLRTLPVIGVMLALVLAPQALAAPAAPAGLTGMAQDGPVALAWQPVSGATGYTVYRGTSPTAITTPLLVTGLSPIDLSTPAFTDSTAVKGTTYYYAVRATAAGQESSKSLVVQATPSARSCADGNPVTAENCLAGDDTWLVPTAGTTSIEGFATAQSVNKGGSIALKVRSNAKFDVEVYRNGYYGGKGGRLFSVVKDVPAVSQPACVSTAATGLMDCSNWAVSTTISTTSAWPSGVYSVRIVRRDTGAANQILFVVRDDERRSDVLYGVPFSTYQAYNNWGGKSLYGFNSPGGQAVKVSFDRPYAQPQDANPLIKDWYSRSDSAWVSWLERSGYDVTYTSVTDLEHAPVGSHRVYLSGAHDEYWSAAMRSSVTAARDAGTNLIFGGANEAYWKVRFEPGPTTGVPDRVMVCYKTPQTDVTDPSGISTSTWRDPAGPNQPENALTGGQYIGDNASAAYPLRVSAEEGQDRVWRYTGLDTLAAGTTVSIGTSLVGWEWDARTANGLEPPGTTTLATSNVSGNILQDAGRTYTTGPAAANAVKYRAGSGALVFATGTNQWNWGLANTAAGTGEPDTRIRQATTNVLADMAALPETPIPGMVFDRVDPVAPPPANPDAVPTAEPPSRATVDNCPGVANADQADVDDDGIGDACEVLPPGNRPPVAGSSMTVRKLSGTVSVTLPKRTPVPLDGVASIPVGSIVDTRGGQVVLVSALRGTPSTRQSRATLTAGIVRISQDRPSKRHAGASIPTELTLLSPSGAERRCRPAKAKGAVRTLSATTTGLHRVIGGASIAAATDATWTTTDRCDGTLTRVSRGRVRVSARRGAATSRTVTARRSHLAKARPFAGR